MLACYRICGQQVTSMGKDTEGQDQGLRHNVVHVGANLEDLLD